MSTRLVLPAEGPALEAGFALRYRVFVVEQLVAIEEELDALDEPGSPAVHVVILDGDHPPDAPVAVGVGRMVMSEDGVVAKMQRIAVDPRRRGEGLGVRIMDALEEEARRRGARFARLSSQVSAQPFYERVGYFPYGPLYLDADIPHRDMDKVI